MEGERRSKGRMACYQRQKAKKIKDEEAQVQEVDETNEKSQEKIRQELGCRIFLWNASYFIASVTSYVEHWGCFILQWGD